jgi:hypothetical protein
MSPLAQDIRSAREAVERAGHGELEPLVAAEPAAAAPGAVMLRFKLSGLLLPLSRS